MRSNQHAGSGCPDCIFKANSQKVKISCLVLSARHGKSTLWLLLFCTQGNRSQHLLVQTQLFNNHQHKSTCEVQCWLSPDIGCINLLKDCLAVTAILVAPQTDTIPSTCRYCSRSHFVFHHNIDVYTNVYSQQLDSPGVIKSQQCPLAGPDQQHDPHPRCFYVALAV